METRPVDRYVEKLDLSGQPSCDFGQIERCVNLRELRVNGCNIATFSQLNLNFVPQLRVLEARDNVMRSFEGLSSLPALEVLDVRGNQFDSTSLGVQFGVFPGLQQLLFDGRVGSLHMFQRFFLESTPMPTFFNSFAFQDMEFQAQMSKVGQRGAFSLKLKQASTPQTKNSAVLIEIFSVQNGEVRLLQKTRQHVNDTIRGQEVEFLHSAVRYIVVSVCFRGSRSVCLYVLTNEYAQVDYNVELARCLQLVDERPQPLLSSKYLDGNRSSSPAGARGSQTPMKRGTGVFGVLQAGQVIPFLAEGATVLTYYATHTDRRQIIKELGGQLRSQHGISLPPDELQRILLDAIQRFNKEFKPNLDYLPEFVMLETRFGSITHMFRLHLEKLFPRPDGRTACGQMDYFIAAYFRTATGSISFQISEQPVQKQAEEFELRIVDRTDRVEAIVHRSDGTVFGDIIGTHFSFYLDSHLVQSGPQNVWIKDGRQGVAWATWESPWCEIDSNRIAVDGSDGFVERRTPNSRAISPKAAVQRLGQRAEIIKTSGVVMTPLVQKVLGQGSVSSAAMLIDPQYQSYKDRILQQGGELAQRAPQVSFAGSAPMVASTNMFATRKSVGPSEGQRSDVWNPSVGTVSTAGDRSELHERNTAESVAPVSPPVLVKKQATPKPEQQLKSPALQIVTIDPITGNRAVKDYVPSYQTPRAMALSPPQRGQSPGTTTFVHQNGLTFSPRLPSQSLASVHEVAREFSQSHSMGRSAKQMGESKPEERDALSGSQYVFKQPTSMATVRVNGRVASAMQQRLGTAEQLQKEDEIRAKSPAAMQPLRQQHAVDLPAPSDYRVDLPQHGDRRLIRRQEIEPWVWPEGFCPPCLYTLWTPSRDIGEQCVVKLQSCVSKNQPRLQVFSREIGMPFQTGLRPSHAQIRIEPLDNGWAVNVKFALTDLGTLMYLLVHFEQDVEILLQLTETPVYGPAAVADVHDQLLSDQEAAIDCYQLDFAASRAIPSQVLLNPRAQKITLTQQRNQAVFDGALTEIILLDNATLQYNTLLLQTGLRKYCFELLDTLVNRELLQRHFDKYFVFEPQKELSSDGAQAYGRMGLKYSRDLIERMAAINDQGTLNMFLFETKEKRDRFFVKAKTTCGAHLPRDTFMALPLLNYQRCSGIKEYKTRLSQLYQPVPGSIASSQLMDLSKQWQFALILDGYQMHVQQTLTQYLQLFDSYHGFPVVIFNRLQAGQTFIKTARLGLPDQAQQDFQCSAYRYGAAQPSTLRVGPQDVAVKTPRWSGKIPLRYLQTFIYNGGLVIIGAGVEARLDFTDAWAMEEAIRAMALRQKELIRIGK